MPANQLVFNGINGSRGGYLQPPLTAQQVSALARGKPIEPDKLALKVLQKWWARLQRKFFAPLEGIDPRNLAQTGWGVIYAADADPAVRRALAPLLKLRQDQAGRYFKEFIGPLAFRSEDTKETFLVRSKASPGNPADPTKVPYYLLIVGDPETIPYRFQYQLDLEYAVGRIHFDTIAEYERYAVSVEAAETKGVSLPRRAVFFGTKNPDDLATGLSSEQLIQPLLKELQGDAELAKQWEFAAVLNKDATKGRLGRLIGGSETPAFVFTASHGMGFERTDARQREHQGALLCQDWPGPLAWPANQPIPEDHYFSADDVKDTAAVQGLIAFHFACYGAGTPRLNDFPDLAGSTPDEIAPRAFLARLPQRLLSHPAGGSLAVIGHVERAWGYSFSWPGADAQTGAFRSALLRLLHGYPVGAATEWLNQRYANLSSDLSAKLEDIKHGEVPDDDQLSGMWTANNDARSYVIVGDPAVRLAGLPSAGAKDVDAGRAGATSLGSGGSSGPSTPGVGEAPRPPSSAPSGTSGGAIPAGPGAVEAGFAAPEGYTDLTHYAFQAPDGLRRLEVRPAMGLGGPDDLLHAARAYRDQVVDLLCASVVQDVTPGARPDGADVATLSITCPTDARRRWILERVGFVRFRDGGGAQVSFVSDPDDPEAEAIFQRALNSARPASRGEELGRLPFGSTPALARPTEASGSAAAQRAGAVALDVAEGLRPPTLYHFASADGKVRLSLELEPDAAAVAVPFASPPSRGTSGLFGQVGVAEGDLGAAQRYEEMEETAAPESVAFAPGAGSKGAGQLVDSRDVVIGGVRVRLSARSDSPERARQALESFAPGPKRP